MSSAVVPTGYLTRYMNILLTAAAASIPSSKSAQIMQNVSIARVGVGSYRLSFTPNSGPSSSSFTALVNGAAFFSTVPVPIYYRLTSTWYFVRYVTYNNAGGFLDFYLTDSASTLVDAPGNILFGLEIRSYPV